MPWEIRDTSRRSSISRQVFHLTLHQVVGPLPLGFHAGLAGKVDGTVDGGERVPQLVSKHRHELVLPPVGVGEQRLVRLGPIPRLLGGPEEPLAFLLQPPAVGDVADVALDDAAAVLLVDVADELDLARLPRPSIWSGRSS